MDEEFKVDVLLACPSLPHTLRVGPFTCPSEDPQMPENENMTPSSQFYTSVTFGKTTKQYSPNGCPLQEIKTSSLAVSSKFYF